MADGGEGTVDALVNATHGKQVEAHVTGPLGNRVTAAWGILGDGTTAVIEMAAASGLTLVTKGHLDPTKATSYGTGELIRSALDAGCRRLIIGIGGSATNDGGVGMAQALGASFLDGQGRELPRGGTALTRLRRIDVSDLDGRIAACHTTVACDVTNPLCGENGASWVYGPQKGATPQMCHQLDEALANYAAVVRRDLAIDIKDLPGAGAAGGLGAGLVVFLRADIIPGVDVVSEADGLAEHLRSASLVMTGEGRLDPQTASGKTVSGVTARASALSVPVVALAGEISGDLSELYRQGLTAALSIAPGPISLEEAMRDAEHLVADAAERAMRLFLTEPRQPSD